MRVAGGGPSTYSVAQTFMSGLPKDARTPGSGGLLLEVAGSNGARTSLEVDHVIAATGYRVDVDKLQFLTPETRARIAHTAAGPACPPPSSAPSPGCTSPALPLRRRSVPS